MFTSVTSWNSETAAATASRSLPHQSTELSSALLDWLFILHAFEHSWSTQLHADRMINNVVCERFWIQTAEVRWQKRRKQKIRRQQATSPPTTSNIHPPTVYRLLYEQQNRVVLASKRTLIWQTVNLHSVLLGAKSLCSFFCSHWFYHCEFPSYPLPVQSLITFRKNIELSKAFHLYLILVSLESI